MKSWFGKFFSQDEEVERVLRRRPEMPQAGEGLHDGIMRAVRVARTEEPRRQPMGMAWGIMATAAAAVVVGAIWLTRTEAPSPMPTKTLAMSTAMAAAPGAAFDLGTRMPGMLMAPLTNELARVDQDLHATTQVLLESFP